jgi:hypothetical protein
MSAIDHIVFLADKIGPRGSTGEAEADAAKFAVTVLTGCGLEPKVNGFKSARSNWHPYALFSAIMLLAIALSLVGGGLANVLALTVGMVGVISVLLELSFRPNPLRWLLPKSGSQNVSAQIRARKKARRKVVLIGHLDTHRTPIVFSSDTWLKIFRLLIPLGLFSSVTLLALFAISIFTGSDFWRLLVFVPGLILAAVFAVTLQADFTPFTHGANDNASGAGVVLGIAERLAREPLEETDVWVVLTGCEEVGCYGAEAFARAHKGEIAGASWLTLDSVGGRGTFLGYLTRETFLLTTHSDASLLDLADEVAVDNPELGGRRHKFSGAFTEGAIGGKHAMRVLTFIAVRPDGSVPNWHKPSDTLERIDESAIARCDAFLRQLLLRIDKSRMES